jgi:hypothetical protein
LHLFEVHLPFANALGRGAIDGVADRFAQRRMLAGELRRLAD